MSNNQDEYNRSRIYMAGGSHNDAYNPNTVANYNNTGTLGTNTTAGGYPASGSHGGGAVGGRRRAKGGGAAGNNRSASGSGAKSDPQTVWAWVGAIAGGVGVFYTDLMSSVDPDYSWMVPVAAAFIGAFIGYKMHKALSALLVIGMVGGAIYFFTQSGA